MEVVDDTNPFRRSGIVARSPPASPATMDRKRREADRSPEPVEDAASSSSPAKKTKEKADAFALLKSAQENIAASPGGKKGKTPAAKGTGGKQPSTTSSTGTEEKE
jgi:hypothetical protein